MLLVANFSKYKISSALEGLAKSSHLLGRAAPTPPPK